MLKFAHGSMSPCQLADERRVCAFLFLAIRLAVSLLKKKKNWALRNLKFLVKEIDICKAPPLLTCRRGVTEHVCKFSAPISKKRCEFCPIRAVNTQFFTALPCNRLVSVMGSTLDVKYGLVLVLRSHFFQYLRETFYRHALGHLQRMGSFTKKGGLFLPKRPTVK